MGRSELAGRGLGEVPHRVPCGSDFSLLLCSHGWCPGRLLAQLSARPALPHPMCGGRQGQSPGPLVRKLPPHASSLCPGCHTYPMLFRPRGEFKVTSPRCFHGKAKCLRLEADETHPLTQRRGREPAQVSKPWDRRVVSRPALSQQPVGSGSLRPRGCPGSSPSRAGLSQTLAD